MPSLKHPLTPFLDKLQQLAEPKAAIERVVLSNEADSRQNLSGREDRIERIGLGSWG